MNYETTANTTARGPVTYTGTRSPTGDGEFPHAGTAEPAEPADPLAEDRTDGGTSRRRWVIIALIVVAAIAAYLVYRSMSADAAPATDRDAQLPTVTVIAPGQTTVEGAITATGTLAARREMPVGVVGEGGRVVAVNVDAGDWVRQGQVLATIDRSVQNEQVRSGNAQIAVARSEANLAQANLDRSLQLVERGFVSKADVDRLTATRDGAVARQRVAEAQVGELRARNNRLNVVAPASGLVLGRAVEPGQTVGAGSGTLFRIARAGEMEMLAQVGETELASIGPGAPATVTPTGSTRTFTGQVWQVSPVIDPQNRQGTVRIALDYAEGLRPGGFATATLQSGTVVAPILPESAVLADAEGAYVYVVGSDNKAQRRRVQTGMVTSKGIVISSGLTGRERIVLRAGGFLTEGETVKPQLSR